MLTDALNTILPITSRYTNRYPVLFPFSPHCTPNILQAKQYILLLLHEYSSHSLLHQTTLPETTFSGHHCVVELDSCSGVVGMVQVELIATCSPESRCPVTSAGSRALTGHSRRGTCALDLEQCLLAQALTDGDALSLVLLLVVLVSDTVSVPLELEPK